MKKNILLIPIATILVVSLVACAAPAPEPGTTPELDMEQEKWDYLIWLTKVTASEDIEVQLAFERVKERTNGLLDIRVIGQGTLPIKSEDWLRALEEGEIAMLLGSTDGLAGDFPAFRLFEPPYLWHNQVELLQIFYGTLPIIDREMNKRNAHVLSYRPQVGKAIFLTNPVESIMDLGGVKVRAPGLSTVTILEAINGNGVNIAWTETYSAIEKGVVDGVFTGIDSIILAGMHELAPYFYDLDWTATLYPILVNKSMWDALPRDARDIVVEELNRALAINQTRIAGKMAELKAIAQASGLKEWNDDVTSPEFFELMNEKATKPLLADAIERVDPALSNEVLNVFEATLGRKVR